ncbi:MAG: hypothetical protein K2I79_02180, partial [Clostridia bacterium]|nr:hypothetical protein [Clostridia bacterium]
LVACKDKDDGNNATTNYSATLVSNGNFDSASGSYPMSPSNWTAAHGSSSTSASLKTPNSSDDLVAGVIDVNDERNYRRQFGSIQPGKVGKDNNILAIYNKKATAYKYTSSSISIDADSVYKLSVWCKTDLYDSESDAYDTWKSNNGTVSKEFTGAYINVTGVAFASFQGIDTQGQWQEFVLYINSNNASTGTISISLGLGDGNWESGHMTAGYAYFDYVTLVKLNSEYRDSDSAYVNGNDNLSKDEANEKALADYINAVQGTSDSKFIGKDEQSDSHKVHTAKYNSALGDTQFDYVTTTSQPYTASNWSGKAGTKPDGSTHSTSSTYLQRGVLDVKYMDQSIVNDASSYAGFTLDAPDTEDAAVVYNYNSGYSRTNSNVLYINNRRNNVYSYRSSVAYKVEAGDYYKLKVYVKTYGNNAAASVKLTYGSDYVALASVNGIKTDGEWQAVELYVKGDIFRDRTLNVELWLGENNTDGCIGIAMFDSVSWEEVDASAYNAANSDIKGEFANENDIEYKEIGDSDSSAIDYVVDTDNTYDSSYAKLLKKGDSYNGANIDIALNESNTQGVWVMDNTIPTRTAIMPNIDIASSADTSNLVKVESNTYIILSAWVKTSEIKSGGLSVALYEYDIEALNKAIADGKVTQANKGNLADYKTSKASLTSLTSKSLESYIKDAHNGYAMISFAIEGAAFKDCYVGLEFALGSGSNANSSSYVSGNAMITNLMIEISAAATHSSTSSAT